jgi:hypothetical protein
LSRVSAEKTSGSVSEVSLRHVNVVGSSSDS